MPIYVRDMCVYVSIGGMPVYLCMCMMCVYMYVSVFVCICICMLHTYNIYPLLVSSRL